VLTIYATAAAAAEPVTKSAQPPKATHWTPGADAEKAEKPAPTGRRTITVEATPGGSVPAIRVAKSRTTTLIFDGAIKAIELLDAAKIFAPPPSTAAGKTVYLTTLRDPGSVVTTMMVVMASGAELPFQLVGVKDAQDADVVVDVLLAKAAASPEATANDEAAAACCTSAGQLRQELDECRAATRSDVLRKIAEVILAEDAAANAQSVVFEGRRSTRSIDKQSGLLVEATGLYRMFGNTYLVMTVENRVADRTWTLDRAQVRLTGAGADLPVIATLTEFPALRPSETEKIVILFTTPTKRAKSSIAVTLMEKSGNRNVTLDVDL
jgi:hypothetical protein